MDLSFFIAVSFSLYSISHSMKKLVVVPTLSDIENAHESIKPFIHNTPVISNASINRLLCCRIYFKCENLQKVGAFKMRGASCAVASLTKEEQSRGIATHSSGNHAQAVARSAQLRGIPSHIVMPTNAPSIKRAAVADYGAQIYTSGPRIEDRESMMEEVIEQTGATFIHPYDHYNIIAGQATAAKELLESVEALDLIMAPIGGGGLMSGTALYTKYAQPLVKVVGTEPKLVDDAYRSYRSGQVETNERIDTIADGLRTNLSQKTLDIIRAHVDDIRTVEELSIVKAMRLIWERMKVIVEPSAAVPLAAVLENPAMFKDQRIGIILSGGNVDLLQLPFGKYPDMQLDLSLSGLTDQG